MAKSEEKNDEILKSAEEILLNATKRAEEIIAKAEMAAKGINQSQNYVRYEQRPEILAEIKRNEETVPVSLHKDDDRYKDDVYVAIGGKNILIKRGVAVLIPRKYDNILKQSKIQNYIASDIISRLSGTMLEIGTN